MTVCAEPPPQVINSARAAGGIPRDICYIVDSMSAFGCYDVDVAKSGIDFVVSSANKNLQGVPGFAFVIGSKRRIADCKVWQRHHPQFTSSHACSQRPATPRAP